MAARAPSEPQKSKPATSRKEEQTIQKTHEESTALEERIRTRAYEIYLESGGQHGNHVEHWLQAETEILGAKQG